MANTFSFEDASTPLDGGAAPSNTFSFEEASTAPAKPSGLVRRALGDTAVSLGKGVVGAGESLVGLADLATGGLAGKALNKATGYDPKATKAAFDEFYSPEQQAANKAVREADGFMPTLGALAKNPSAILQSVAESAPSIVGAGGGAQLLGKAGILTKNALARGAISEGLFGAGQQAEQFRQENPDGTLSARQELASLGSGAGTAAFAGIGGKVAQKLGIADLDTVLAGGKVPTAAAKQGLARRIGEGFVSEGALEEMPQSAWEQMAQNFGNEKSLTEGVGNAAATGLVVGGVMSGGMGAASRSMSEAGKPGNQPAPSQPADAPIPYTPTTVAEVAQQRNAAMGLDPAAGPLSAVASMAVESQTAEEIRLSTPQILAEGAQAAERARAEQEARMQAEPGIPFELPASGQVEQPAGAQQQADRPRGSFGQMDELAQLVEQERADQRQRIGSVQQAQEAARQAADEYANARLAEIEQTIADNRQRQSEAARVEMLHDLLADPSTSNAAERFQSELARQGYRDTSLTPREAEVIKRHSEISDAFKQWTAGPTDAFRRMADAEELASLVGQERADVEQRREALRRPAERPAPQPRDKVQQALSLIASGGTLQGRNIVSPSGKVLMKNLNIQQYQSVRQKLKSDAQAAPAQAQQVPGAAPNIAPVGPSIAAQAPSTAAAAPNIPQEAPDGATRPDTAGVAAGRDPQGSVDARGVVDPGAGGRSRAGGQSNGNDAAQPAAGVQGAGAGVGVRPADQNPVKAETPASAGPASGQAAPNQEPAGLERAVQILNARTDGVGSPDGLAGSENARARAEIVSALTGESVADLEASPNAAFRTSVLQVEKLLHEAAGINGDGLRARREKFLDWLDGREAGQQKSSEATAQAESARTQPSENNEVAQPQLAPEVDTEAPASTKQAVASRLEPIFSDLNSTSTRKANKARKAAAKLPEAARIEYVQANFHDLLIRLMDAGKLEVNGVASLTEENQSCL